LLLLGSNLSLGCELKYGFALYFYTEIPKFLTRNLWWGGNRIGCTDFGPEYLRGQASVPRKILQTIELACFSLCVQFRGEL